LTKTATSSAAKASFLAIAGPKLTGEPPLRYMANRSACRPIHDTSRQAKHWLTVPSA
jgi:hypothetical protein